MGDEFDMHVMRVSIEVQGEIINDLRKENERLRESSSSLHNENKRLTNGNARLRELMRNLVENAEGGDYGEIIVLDVDFIEIEKEVGDE